MVAALGLAIDALGVAKPYVLVVQGYILGQYGLLHALAREQVRYTPGGRGTSWGSTACCTRWPASRYGALLRAVRPALRARPPRLLVRPHVHHNVWHCSEPSTVLPPPCAQDVAKLLILNTPLSTKARLRPELAAYKSPLPFLRPKPDAAFDAANFNAAGGPYAMAMRDAQAYAGPYEEGAAASAAVAAIMGQVRSRTRVD